MQRNFIPRNRCEFYYSASALPAMQTAGPTKSRPDNVLTPPGAVRMPPGSVDIRILQGPSRYHQQPQPHLSVVTVGWLLELSFKKPSKMRSLMA